MASDGTQQDEVLPRSLGPYRVEERLGAGGMGEVYRGYDDRLDRPVALKRIKPEPGGSEERTARARFQREARAVARLSHPSVVQVYDWVEEGGADWIVMELIDGRSLRGMLAEGLLSVGQALSIARDIASGLKAAHAAGIVHRDLKADNVMVTSEGEVKILDFGLAKHYDTEDAPPTELTVHGQIVGTVSGMSPEQALGQPLDHRSDLFSLGTLIYELLTGVSPFRGRGPAETLTRICTLQPTPVHVRRPEVSAEVSDFVAQLLEKDPGRRPAVTVDVVSTLERFVAESSATDVTRPAAVAAAASDLEDPTLLAPGIGDPTLPRSAASLTPSASGTEAPAAASSRRWPAIALLTAAAVLAFLVWRGSRPDVQAERLDVVVPPTAVAEAARDEPAARLLAGAVHAGILRGLLGLAGVSALELGRAIDPGDPVAAAFAVGADEVLVSELDCALGTCQIVLRRLQGSDGAVLWLGRLSADAPRLDLPAEGARVAEQVRAGYSEIESRAGRLFDLRVSSEDYAAYQELLRRYQVRDRGADSNDFLAEIEALEARSPDFLEAILFEASVRRQRFAVSRDRDELERGLAAVKRARALAPEDPRTLRIAVQLALDSGRLDEAEAVLEIAERLEPGDVSLMARRASLLERRGRSEDARRLLGQAAERRPSWDMYSRLANMDRRAGDVEAARRHLEAALVRAPGYFDLRSRLALLELLDGSPRRAAELYEELVEQTPEETELSNLGVAHLLLEDYEAAARRFRQALELAPDSPHALLNLADAELLRGDEAAAHELYRRVLDRVVADPDPDALLTVRAQAQAHLGLAEEAVGSAQQALRLAPDDPQMVYEAALAHALAGDTASALWHARRARELGLDERWFGFPWFDGIRPRLESHQ